MSVIERAEDGTLKVTWTVLPASGEDHYLVPRSHADALNEEFETIRQQLEGAVEDAERLARSLRAVLDRHGCECGVCVEAEQAIPSTTTGGQ